MAFTGNFMCTSFKSELMTKIHDFTVTTGDSFKIALYDGTAAFTAATTAYTATNEVVGSGYSAGGKALTNISPVTSGTTAYADFADLTWSTSTITALGGLLYNDTAAGNPAVLVLDFGGSKVSSGGDFTIVFPAAAAATAIIRIA